MITSEFTDKDGFKLQFDDTCSEADKKFFREQYPKVDLVANQKLHCTTCDIHIGTAPISEKIIRTHQVLGVTQCNKCFAFYNSGEFGKGEDGSEYYCRWCGQGGEVFCCSTCPFVFCNKCIRGNMTQAYVKQIEENDDWSCFVCDKSILQKHRGHHWALRNFMNKQLEKIQKINITSEEDLNNLLNEDVSTCCPRRKRKSLIKPVPAPVKRPAMNGGYMSVQPPAKKISIQPPPKQIRMPTAGSYRPPNVQGKPGPAGKRNNDEIVCTPDIMGLFNDNHDDNPMHSSNMMPSTSLAPPPLVMRNNPRPIRPQPSAPIYHNVNGFQIDLNHAARQEIFRLPNGKLIQVRKQTGPPAQAPLRPGMPIAPPPRGPQFTIRQANPSTPRQSFQPRASPQARQRFNSQPQTRFTFSDGRVVAQPVPSAASATPTPAASTVFTQQNGSISVARAPQPNTPFGAAKTEFEDKIISGMEICQHTINKMITLTNSTSFKTSRNFKDLKDLYIHLQYLFTYTSGKFTTLQDSLKTGMESLAKHDEKLKEKTEPDELEIVEEKQDVIEVMSDDDEDHSAQKDSEKTPNIPVKKPLLKHIQYTKDSSENSTAEANQDSSEMSTIPAQTPKETVIEEKLSAEVAEMLENDKKLKNRVVVKVEKLEDTKNPVIKQYMAKLQERMERESSESRESTPINLFEPMVMIDEGQQEENKESEDNGQVEPVNDGVEKTLEEKEKTDDVVEKSNEAEKAENVDEIVEVPSDDEDNEVTETTPVVEKNSDDVEPMETESETDKKIETENVETECNGETEKVEEVETPVEEPEEVEAPAENPENVEAPAENPENVETPAENPTTDLDDNLLDIIQTSEEKAEEIAVATEEIAEKQDQTEIMADISQDAVADDTVPTNGFLDCTPLAEKNSDDLPTIEEVTKIVSTEIDEEKAILEDLFNELENKSMEVD